MEVQQETKIAESALRIGEAYNVILRELIFLKQFMNSLEINALSQLFGGFDTIMRGVFIRTHSVYKKNVCKDEATSVIKDLNIRESG
ncbi:MAG: hypothetical protein V3U54_07870 [Thermodesulfobacteriota bacterium]